MFLRIVIAHANSAATSCIERALSTEMNNDRADGRSGDPYFFYQKQILFTIISTLPKNEQKINEGSLKNFKISVHRTWNPAILRLQGT